MKEKVSIAYGTKVLKSLVRNKISLLLYIIYMYSIVSQYYYHLYFIPDLNASTNDVFIFVFVNAYFEITYFYQSLFLHFLLTAHLSLLTELLLLWSVCLFAHLCQKPCQVVKFCSGIKCQESYNLYDSRNSVSGML